MQGGTAVASDAWKDHERMMAKRLGGQRAGPTGKIGSDVLHDHLAIEAKERKRKVAWLEDMLLQTKKAARPGQLPIVILHWLNARHNSDIVLLRLKDFEEWFGDVGNPEASDS
jgi:hypothetical protein